VSVWREILLKDIEDIRKINFAKLNCKLQQIADEFMKEGMTRNEVFLITEAIKDKTMLNEEIALGMFQKNYECLLRAEGVVLNSDGSKSI
jgi:hypothetical protein